MLALAERAGLESLVRRHVRITARTGVYPEVKVGCLVAGIASGADSIDDMGLLRHGAMPELFGGPAPSQRSGRSCARSPGVMSASWRRRAGSCSRSWPAAPLLPGADVLAFVDIDSMQRRVSAVEQARVRAYQGAARRMLVRGLNTLGRHRLHTAAAPVSSRDPLRAAARHRPRRRELRRRGDQRRPVFRVRRNDRDPARLRVLHAAFVAAYRRPGAFSVARPDRSRGHRRDRRDPRGCPRQPSATRRRYWVRFQLRACDLRRQIAEIALPRSPRRARPSPPG